MERASKLLLGSGCLSSFGPYMSDRCHGHHWAVVYFRSLERKLTPAGEGGIRCPVMCRLEESWTVLSLDYQ
jgi:hypothetical protein